MHSTISLDCDYGIVQYIVALLYVYCISPLLGLSYFMYKVF